MNPKGRQWKERHLSMEVQAATKDRINYLPGPKKQCPSDEVDGISFVSFPVSTLLFLPPTLAPDEAC
jgi:hypothetical protein